MQLNQKNFHNLQSHLAHRHTKLWIIIRHRVCESLVKIHYFRHEWSFMYKIFKKRKKIKEHFITCSYIWYINTSGCVFCIEAQSVFWRCVITNPKILLILVIFYFLDLGTYCRPAQKTYLEIRLRYRTIPNKIR